jgi:transposase
MSEQEMLVLSTKDRDRLKVVHEGKGEHLTQRAAAQPLGISDRGARKLLGRVKPEGDRGVVQRRRGRASNRRLPESVGSQALELVPTRYGDFGPRLACEYLAKEHELKMSRETLRKWLAGAAELPRRVGARGHLGARRARRAGPKLYLVAMIDDATSQGYVRLVEHDSPAENRGGGGDSGSALGRPLAFYTDKGSLFRVQGPPPEAEDEAVKEAKTQIGRP